MPRYMLNGRPVFGLNGNLVIDPVGNGLLAKGLATEIVGDAIRQCFLAADNTHRSFDRVSAHGKSCYTSGLVSSTSASVSQTTRPLVIFEAMSKATKHSELGLRVTRAMTKRGVTEASLVAKIQEWAPGDAHEKLRGKLSQQMVNYITQGGAERSFYTPFLAAALDVPCIWLAFGLGPDPFAEEQPLAIEAQTDRERKLLRAFRTAEDPVRRAIEKALSTDIEIAKKRSKKAGVPKKIPRAA